MEPTNPVDGTNVGQVEQNQETLEKSNVQRRIDEITAEKHAAMRQVEQLTTTVAEMLKRQNEMAIAQRPVPQQEQVPEGLDPAIAKYLSDQLKKTQEATVAQTQQLYWQLQHQMDNAQVAQKYAHLPPEVVKDAAQRLTGLKQQYGQAANMEDAIALAYYQYAQKNQGQQRAQQFNQMGQPLTMQGAPPAVQQQSTNLVSPASLPNWDSLDNATQNALISDFEKKGGRLM